MKELTNTPGERLFYLTNPGNLFLDYDGFVVALQKRLSRRWQASGSYTFSGCTGCRSRAMPPRGRAVQHDCATDVADVRPGSQRPDECHRRLPNDRPHVFRTTGVVYVPWGLQVAANLQHFTGRPWAATAQVRLNQSGNQRILIEPRGSRRLSSQSLLDLRIAKTSPWEALRQLTSGWTS